jgi:hypothetical protein
MPVDAPKMPPPGKPRRVPFPYQLVPGLPRNPHLPPRIVQAIARAADGTEQCYWLTLVLFAHFFDWPWVVRWITGPRGEPGNFLLNDDCNGVNGQKHQLRVIRLAELLLRLQHVPGFWDVLDTMVEQGVEVGISELEAGERLMLCGIKFAFRKPIGQKGFDYDLDIWPAEGLHICGETKCKIQSTTAKSVETVMRSIRDARKRNLPADKPAVVFVKIPKEWVDDPAFNQDLDRAYDHLFARSELLVGVTTFCSDWLLVPGLAVEVLMCKPRMNEASPLFDPRMAAVATEASVELINPAHLWLRNLPPIQGVF